MGRSMSKLDKYRDFLKERIDTDKMLDCLMAKTILSKEEVDEVKSRPTMCKKNETLLDIIIEKEKEKEFIEALADANQRHLANYLLNDGVRTQNALDDWPLLTTKIQIIDINCGYLKDMIDSGGGLLDNLIAKKVISHRHKQLICSKATDSEKTEAFLDILRRGSMGDYENTIQCLRDSNQYHIAEILDKDDAVNAINVVIKTIHDQEELDRYFAIEGNDAHRIIRPTSATDGNCVRRVRGFAILNDELFVAFEISAVIDIFHIDNSTSTRSAEVKDLVDPGAIAACATNNCLYIMDKRSTSRKQIIRIDANGTVLCAWQTDDDDRGRISVNREGNIVMTVYDKHKLKIYSPEGILIKTINFSDIPTPDPIEFIFHAINLDDGNFILCHGIYKSEVHRVCKVDATGKLLLSFGSEKGSDEEHLSSPAYVATRNDGSILVADQKNHRIIQLSSDLKFEAVLFTVEDGVSLPTSMYVYEKPGSSLLFLGCNETKTFGGYVLVLRLGQ